MKIAISTIVSGNYGNRLQNYALQEFLKSLDESITVETLNRNYARFVFLSRIKKQIKMFRDKDKRNKEVRKMFQLFNDQYIHFSDDTVYIRRSNRELNNHYDCFITGSDQVWNPGYTLTSGSDFLSYADPKKRISYAASFGMDVIPENRKTEFKNYLEGMRYISVREESGARIVKELCGKTAEVLIDPAMLLPSARWKCLECAPKWYQGQKFIASYILGQMDWNDLEVIEKISNKMNLSVIDACGPDHSVHSINEFLWVLHHAELIFTDSFHGSVFSILYHKDFWALSRKGNENNTGSRLTTLLEKFSLHNRIGDFSDKCTVPNIDYSNADRIVENERNKAEHFLRTALGLAL